MMGTYVDCCRETVLVPTARIASASRRGSWPSARRAATPRLPRRVRLAGAVPLAPADPLPAREFAWIPEADTYLNKNRLSAKLNYTLHPSPNTG